MPPRGSAAVARAEKAAIAAGGRWGAAGKRSLRKSAASRGAVKSTLDKLAKEKAVKKAAVVKRLCTTRDKAGKEAWKYSYFGLAPPYVRRNLDRSLSCFADSNENFCLQHRLYKAGEALVFLRASSERSLAECGTYFSCFVCGQRGHRMRECFNGVCSGCSEELFSATERQLFFVFNQNKTLPEKEKQPLIDACGSLHLHLREQLDGSMTPAAAAATWRTDKKARRKSCVWCGESSAWPNRSVHNGCASCELLHRWARSMADVIVDAWPRDEGAV